MPPGATGKREGGGMGLNRGENMSDLAAVDMPYRVVNNSGVIAGRYMTLAEAEASADKRNSQAADMGIKSSYAAIWRPDGGGR